MSTARSIPTTSATTSCAPMPVMARSRASSCRGSHASTYEEHDLRAPQAVLELGVPVLGICYGMQTMARAAGRQGRGQRTPRVRLRRGARARPHRAARRHRGLRHARRPRHAQGVDEPRRQGHRAAARLQADGQHAQLPDRRHGRRSARLLRVQFHPEVTHTRAGPGAARALRARHLRRAGPTGSCATTSPRRWRGSARRWATKK